MKSSTMIVIFGLTIAAAGQQSMGTVATPGASAPSVGAVPTISHTLCYSNPTREFFFGNIAIIGTTAGQAVVSYKWIHSDGSTGASGSVSGEPGQVFTPTDEWDGQSSGWGELQITTRVTGVRYSHTGTSPRASFTCNQPGASSPPPAPSSPPSASTPNLGGGGKEYQVERNRITSPLVPPAPSPAATPAPATTPGGTAPLVPRRPYPGSVRPSVGSGSSSAQGIRFTINIRAGACVARTPRPQYFVGSLYINGNGPLNNIPITYVWIRSDGAVNNPPLTATLTSAHQLNLRDEWIGAPATGWEQVQVTSVNGQPATINSTRATFNCGMH